MAKIKKDKIYCEKDYKIYSIVKHHDHSLNKANNYLITGFEFYHKFFYKGRQLKLNEWEKLLFEKIEYIKKCVTDMIEGPPIEEKESEGSVFAGNPEYLRNFSTQLSDQIKKFKLNFKKSSVDKDKLLKFKLFSSYFEEFTDEVENSFFKYRYPRALTVFKRYTYPVREDFKLFIENAKKENQVNILINVSKKFFQFNGFHAIFNEGYFGENFTLAEKICDYLGLTEKIKDRFCFEASAADDLPKSDDIPKNELKEVRQSVITI